MSHKCLKEEDIFCINERNRNYYIQCKTPDLCLGNCSCVYDQLIIPPSIGNNDFKRNIYNKMYISPNENCIICMQQINIKSDAYLTDCGHSFHKFCLSNYFQYINLVSNKNLKCPMCRTNLGQPCFYEKYNMFHEKANGLDMLENINMSQCHFIHICKNSKSEHYLGINSNCEKCLNYRKNGNIL